MSLTLTTPELSFMTGDRPFIKGQIIDSEKGVIGTRDLLFATIRGTNETNATLLKESKVDLKTSSFEFKFPEPQDRQQFGKVWVRGFYKEAIDAVSDGLISDVATEADLIVNSGEIPEFGNVLIESEVCKFTKLTPTKISLDRAQYETKQVQHESGTAVGFSVSDETCINDRPIEFENQEGDLFRFQKRRRRGEW